MQHKVIYCIQKYTGSAHMKPMSGLKAPDLTHVLAGPYRT